MSGLANARVEIDFRTEMRLRLLISGFYRSTRTYGCADEKNQSANTFLANFSIRMKELRKSPRGTCSSLPSNEAGGGRRRAIAHRRVVTRVYSWKREIFNVPAEKYRCTRPRARRCDPRISPKTGHVRRGKRTLLRVTGHPRHAQIFWQIYAQ